MTAVFITCLVIIVVVVEGTVGMTGVVVDLRGIVSDDTIFVVIRYVFIL